MFIINTLVVVVVLVLSIVNTSTANPRQLRWVVDDSGCRTPDGGVGNCIPLSHCETISSLTLNPENREQLHRYFCSFRSSIISVCCPREPIKIDTVPTVNKRANLLPSECGVSDAIHKITNGEETELFEFPWQVALKYNDRINPFACGGSLINNRYVLTAAHCLRESLIGVRLGEHNFLTNPDCRKYGKRSICAPEPIDIGITRNDIIMHENYSVNSIFENDIALIRLPRQIEFSESISPICLPIKPTFIKELGNLTVAGWGLTEKGRPSPILLKTTVPVVNFNLCRSLFRNTIDITTSHFCAGGKDGKDSCKGDSGGPIMYSVVDDGEIRWVQAGIVSFGNSMCGSEGIPTMYTNVTRLIDWVLDNLSA